MTAQIKQRIVGIAVLAILALIILPWLFGNSQHPSFEDNTVTKEKLAQNELPEQQLQEPAAVNKEQPVADNINEVAEAAQEPEVVTTPKPNMAVANKAIDSKPVIAKLEPEPKPLATTMQQESNAKKITKIENHIVHTSSAEEEEEDTPKAVSSVVAAKKPKAAAKEAIKLDAPRAHKGWTIQLGSFGNKSNADNLVKKLKAQGYPVYTKTSKKAAGDAITRVFVGPNSQRQSLESMVGKINKQFNVQGVIIKAAS